MLGSDLWVLCITHYGLCRVRDCSLFEVEIACVMVVVVGLLTLFWLCHTTLIIFMANLYFYVMLCTMFCKMTSSIQEILFTMVTETDRSIEWSTVSNAALRSSNTSRNTWPLTIARTRSLWTDNTAVSVDDRRTVGPEADVNWKCTCWNTERRLVQIFYRYERLEMDR